MLEVVKFIRKNENWREILSQKPYSLTIKENSQYILLSYSMLDSDFSLPIVKECRGIILKQPGYFAVCVPFFKFHNVQEQLADKIDWKSARVQQKIDGSIIKVWNDENHWNVSTNGTIFAVDAELAIDFGDVRNYYQLFFSAINFPKDLFRRLNPDRTYIFEIVSPLNKVVVPYQKTEIYHIGTRSNITLEELNEDIGIQKPKEYNLCSLEECLNAVQDMPFSEEGYVVVDKNWHRVKIKSPAYVAAHHLRNNGVITKTRVLDMILVNGQDDFLAIYPEYSDCFIEIQFALSDFIETANNQWDDFVNSGIWKTGTRKDCAFVINQSVCPPALYCMLDSKTGSIEEWLRNQTSEKILSWTGIKNG